VVAVLMAVQTEHFCNSLQHSAVDFVQVFCNQHQCDALQAAAKPRMPLLTEGL
jgi:hypothetical protein